VPASVSVLARDHLPVPASVQPEPTPPTAGDRIWRYAAGVSALALTAVPLWRSSETLATLCLLGAIALGSYALVGGRTWGRVIGGAFSLLPGFVRGATWLAQYRPTRRTGNRGAPVRVLVTVVASIALAAILIGLLRSADAVFADLLDSWLAHIPDLDGRSLLGAVLLVFLGVSAAFFGVRGVFGNRPAEERNRPLAGLEWMIPLVVANVIFAVFVAVQIRVLFAGHEHVLKQGGPDYAEYARGGFGELCAVTVLSLGLTALVGALAKRETRAQGTMIRAVGGVLCALTLVIVASALRRMLLYVDAYGFTWLRLVSFAFEIFLGLVLLLVLVAGIRLRGTWLPRAVAAAAAGVLFALVAVNPEALMASTHLDARASAQYPVDRRYMNSLSADAIDVIVDMGASQERDCILESLRAELAEPDPWYEFNLARQHARAVLATISRACR
jgi:hypothetical protein